MATPIRIPLGAPGIYHYPDTQLHALTGVRMDVCAFAGVAPRGPVWVPVIDEKWRDDRPCVEAERPRKRTVAVAVETFDDYVRLFGGFEGPGKLPYAVASFFEQGGRKAYVARVVHEHNDAKVNAGGVATGEVPGAKTLASLPLILNARNEGIWGNQLRASFAFSARPIDSEEGSDINALSVGSASELSPGSLLRLTLKNNTREFRLVADMTEHKHDSRPGFSYRAVYNQGLSDDLKDARRSAEVIEGVLLLDDGDGRTERHEWSGFSSSHSRWLATVLCYESELVFPDISWSSAEIIPSSVDLLSEGWSKLFEKGTDRYRDIEPEDFFDARWTFGDEDPGDGVTALSQISDLSLLVTPDLYAPAPPVPEDDVTDPVSLAGPEFERCVDLPDKEPEQAKAEFDLQGLRLDPTSPDDLKKIVSFQARLSDFTGQLRSFIVLLDVPPGLNHRQILKWRAPFNNDFAAAYHPWLQISRRDNKRDSLVRVPPSAVAAGIIARQELAFGVPHGPANVIGTDIVGVDDRVSSVRHDELHPQGINVYLRERDGIRLTAARTLSRDPAYRQLSVRRLVTMIQRALDQQMQWVVFEPNNSSLRDEVRLALVNYLRQLFRIGAFRGATEDEGFFVRCDESNNPGYVTDMGRLIAEIGIAPSEPLEFIVLRLAREGDGTLTLKEE